MAYGSPVLRQIYDRLPGWGRSLMTTAYAVRTYGSRFGAGYERWSKILEKTQFESTEALRARSLQEALELAHRARSESAFFAERLPEGDFSWEEVPILTKQDVREHMQQMHAADRSAFGRTVVRRTSGTTGTPLELLQTVEAVQRENAFAWQHRSWHGCPRGCRTATLAGHPVVPTSQDRPPYWVHNRYENQLIFSSYHMSPEAMPHYARALERFTPDLIHGYPSSIALVAQAVLDEGLAIRPKAVITASETLLSHQRRLIRDAFGVEPAIWYGNTELAGNIVECPEGRLHVREEHSLTEFLDEHGRPAAPGSEARLVATALGNPAMFLLRYDTGDVVVPSAEERCPCGRAGRLVEQVVGRVEDYIIDGAGRRIGRLDHLFKDVRDVREAQIVQETPGRIVVRLICDRSAFGAARQAVLREVRMRLSPATIVEIERASRLDRGPSGKAAFVRQMSAAR
ncbi:MAG: phenylacetate--CoA ligase family protein [Acidobacteria bacterium]|nr:MAG: phenylacetate--CoA ligase family protein [Acidobacteriota bacterium]